MSDQTDIPRAQMPRPSNAIIAQYPSAEQLLAAPGPEVERVLLRHIVEYCLAGMHPMVTRDGISNGLFDTNGYTDSAQVRTDVQRIVGRAWKALDDAGFIEEPDPDNGKNGFRVPSAKGKSAHAATDYLGVRMRSKFTRDMFHPSLPDAAWNAFSVGDYDTAVFEAFKSLEVAVRTKGGFASTDFGADLMKKAFDPDTGTAPRQRPRRVPGRKRAASYSQERSARSGIRKAITTRRLRMHWWRPRN